MRWLQSVGGRLPVLGFRGDWGAVLACGASCAARERQRLVWRSCPEIASEKTNSSSRIARLDAIRASTRYSAASSLKTHFVVAVKFASAACVRFPARSWALREKGNYHGQAFGFG
jgi:hypothetical protein